MKSKYYIVIFVLVILVVGGILWYNAATIDDIDSEMTKINKRSATEQKYEVIEQRDIDVLTDVDIEEDVQDFDDGEDLSDLDDIIINEDEVTF